MFWFSALYTAILAKLPTSVGFSQISGKKVKIENLRSAFYGKWPFGCNPEGLCVLQGNDININININIDIDININNNNNNNSN